VQAAGTVDCLEKHRRLRELSSTSTNRTSLSCTLLRRDNGERTDRQKARLMWLVENWGVDKFRDAVAARMGDTLAKVRRCSRVSVWGLIIKTVFTFRDAVAARMGDTLAKVRPHCSSVSDGISSTLYQ
jgi:sulfite reductase beta subunit-like hemoprotein